MDSFPYDPSSIDEANLQIRINRNAGMRSLDYDIEDLKQRLQHQMAINAILAKEVNRYNLQRLNDLRAAQAQHNQGMVLQTDYAPRMLNTTYSISGSSNPPTPRYAWNPMDNPYQLQQTPSYQSIQQRRTNNAIESIQQNQHLETMSRSPKTDKGKMISYDWSSQPILPKIPSETYSNYKDVNWAYNPLKNPEELDSNKVDHFYLPCNHSRFSTSWIYDPSYQALGLDSDPLQCVDILKEMRNNKVDGSSNNYINTTNFSTMAAATATNTTNAISMSLPKKNQHHELNPLNVSHDTSVDPLPPVSEEMVYNKNSIYNDNESNPLNVSHDTSVDPMPPVSEEMVYNKKSIYNDNESNPLNVSHDTSVDPMPPISEEMVYNKNSIHNDNESNPLNVSHDTSVDPMPPISEEMVYNKNSIFDQLGGVDFADDYDFFSTDNMLNMEQFGRKKSKSNEWGF